MRGLLVVVGIIGALSSFSSSSVAHAAQYDVGPGQPLAAIGDVPFESLAAGDLVQIHWRAAPYKEKFVVGGTGTAGAPITVRGVPGPMGELPVIDGNGATTRPQLNYWNQPRMVVKVGGSNAPNDNPSYIVIENLDITGGHDPNPFTDASGAAQTYATNAAALLVEDGDHITIRGCILRDADNGLFVSSASSTILVEKNYIHDNGTVGDIYVHNNYTEANGITFQYNHFGPLCPGCSGNNLKDRSAGLVVRYNWIEGGNRQLDLVDSATLDTLPTYHTTFVYGNVLVERDADGNRQIVHYGGDSGDTTIYRKGTLYFYANTLVSRRTDRTTLLRLSSPEETADVRDNILFTEATGDTFSLVDMDGNVDWGWNWIKPGWVDSFSGVTGTITDLGGRVEQMDPGFVDEAASDFHLTMASNARNVGGPFAAAAMPVDQQYVVHQDGMPRGSDGMLDLGAYEFCTSGCEQLPDAGVTPGADAGPGGADAAPHGDGGTTGGGGKSGCGCRVGGRASHGGCGAIFVGMALFAISRARARSRCTRRRR